MLNHTLRVNQFGISEFLETWICFSLLVMFSPQLLQLFKRMLERCFVVKLQKCSVDYETLSNFRLRLGCSFK